jgi:hypothetical protein
VFAQDPLDAVIRGLAILRDGVNVGLAVSGQEGDRLLGG